MWIDSSHNRQVADLGYRFVHASSDYFYLVSRYAHSQLSRADCYQDCGQGEWIGENGGGNSWCDPFKSWAHMYSFNPFGNLTDAQQSQVLGGQTSLWSEQVSLNLRDIGPVGLRPPCIRSHPRCPLLPSAVHLSPTVTVLC